MGLTKKKSAEENDLEEVYELTKKMILKAKAIKASKAK